MENLVSGRVQVVLGVHEPTDVYILLYMFLLIFARLHRQPRKGWVRLFVGSAVATIHPCLSYRAVREGDGQMRIRRLQLHAELHSKRWRYEGE